MAYVLGTKSALLLTNLEKPPVVCRIWKPSVTGESPVKTVLDDKK